MTDKVVSRRNNQEEALQSSIPNETGYLFEGECKMVSNINEGITIEY